MSTARVASVGFVVGAGGVEVFSVADVDATSGSGLPNRSRGRRGLRRLGDDGQRVRVRFGPLAFSHSTHMNSSGSAHAPFAA